VASFPDRASPGGTFSAPFLYERRTLRVRPADRDRYDHIEDFVGKRVGVVRGMAGERARRRRAPAGVEVVATASFPELYAAFDAGSLDAIAEGRVSAKSRCSWYAMEVPGCSPR
jgi:ABC-type amino acid transport substrate-binding protein